MLLWTRTEAFSTYEVMVGRAGVYPAVRGVRPRRITYICHCVRGATTFRDCVKTRRPEPHRHGESRRPERSRRMTG